jgi:hypothetical protein
VFAEREGELARLIADKDTGRVQGLMMELHRSLAKVNPVLGFELGSEADGNLDFCITPDGEVAAFETPREVVEAAPPIARWKVRCFRQRKDLSTVTIAIGGVEAEAKDVRYLARFGAKLDLALLYDLADGVDPEVLYRISAILLDAALGEFDAATGIASLEAVNARHPTALPLLELPAVFDAWRAKIAN